MPASFCGGIECAAADPIVDVPDLMERDKVGVQRMLGKPDKCERTKGGENCQYQGGSKEILFGDGKVRTIIIYADLPYSEAALPGLGFVAEKPDFANEHGMRWTRRMLAAIRVPDSAQSYIKAGETHAQYVEELSLFPGSNGKIFYAYIKAD